MERTHSSQQSRPQLLPARAYRQSAASGRSHGWRSNRDASSSATSPVPGKSFVVPLYLAASTKLHNSTFARGALPSSTRSRTSTRSIIEDAAPTVANLRPLSSPQSKVSDMYAGSLRRSEPIPLARNMDDDSTPSERQATQSSRSGSSRSKSSKRSTKKQGVFSKKSYRDPDVSAKARISFAFGITLLVALVICKQTPLFSRTMTDAIRPESFRYGGRKKYHVSRDIDPLPHNLDRSLSPSTHSHVHAHAAAEKIETSSSPVETASCRSAKTAASGAETQTS